MSISLIPAPVTCRLSDLTSWTATEGEEALVSNLLPVEQPFSLAVTVTLEGSGAIALLALKPSIQVSFYGQPVGAGEAVDLGTVRQPTRRRQRTYTLQTAEQHPHQVGLLAGKAYRIGALLRLGAPDQPALIFGSLETLMVDLYTPAE